MQMGRLWILSFLHSLEFYPNVIQSTLYKNSLKWRLHFCLSLLYHTLYKIFNAIFQFADIENTCETYFVLDKQGKLINHEIDTLNNPQRSAQRCSSYIMHKISILIFFNSCFVYDPVGLIFVLWKENCRQNIQTFSFSLKYWAEAMFTFARNAVTVC